MEPDAVEADVHSKHAAGTARPITASKLLEVGLDQGVGCMQSRTLPCEY